MALLCFHQRCWLEWTASSMKLECDFSLWLSRLLISLARHLIPWPPWWVLNLAVNPLECTSFFHFFSYSFLQYNAVKQLEIFKVIQGQIVFYVNSGSPGYWLELYRAISACHKDCLLKAPSIVSFGWCLTWLFSSALCILSVLFLDFGVTSACLGSNTMMMSHSYFLNPLLTLIFSHTSAFEQITNHDYTLECPLCYSNFVLVENFLSIHSCNRNPFGRVFQICSFYFPIYDSDFILFLNLIC